MSDTHAEQTCDGASVVGSSPAVSAGEVMLTASHATGRLFEAAVSQQQLACQAALASTSQGIQNFFDSELDAPSGHVRISNAVAIARRLFQI